MRTTRPYTRTTPPELQVSIPLLRHRLQRISRTLEVNSYTSLHPQHASRSLVFQRLQRISRAPYLDVPTLAAHLQTSKALEANSYTYLHRLQTSEPPYLHVCTPTAHLPSSRSPYLHTYTPATRLPSSRALEANTSTSPGPQHGARGTRSPVASHEFFG